MEPKWQKMTSKRVLKYGVCPKGAPSGSDGAWRVPLEAIWGSFLMILGCIFIAWSCSFFVANDGDAKTLCHTELLSHGIQTRLLCHTAAAEGAKLSKCAAAGLVPAFSQRVRSYQDAVPTSY